MKYLKIILIVLILITLFLIGQKFTGSAVEQIIVNESSQMSFDNTEEIREEFKKEFRYAEDFKLRNIYEKYYPTLGAQGIIDAVTELRPTCHDEGHDLGKIIYNNSQSIGQALRTCNNACYSGCMHGVFMEVFGTNESHQHDNNTVHDEHINLEDVEELVPEICFNDEVTDFYKPGDCAHGVGHAMMYLSGYAIEEALDACKTFDTKPMKYYCSTGAFMEYNTNQHKRDSENNSIFYPCDVNNYPAACFRYKMVHVVKQQLLLGNNILDVIDECKKLDPENRRGCFHGLGNAFISGIVSGPYSLSDICGLGTKEDEYVCIEGVVERLARYHQEDAINLCNNQTGWQKEVCDNAAQNKLYNLEKNFTLYT